MTAMSTRARTECGPAPLEFRRTVDRTLVHRASVAEVFVTDIAVRDDESCVIGAQLPLSHGYYNDHCSNHYGDRSTPGPVVDPLLFLECCRQGAIYGSHSLMQVRLGSSMIVSSLSLRLTDLAATISGPRPAELAMETTYRGRRTPRGRVRNAGVVQELWLDGHRVGTHELQLVVVRDSEIQALRSIGRGTPPPSTSDLTGAVAPDRLPAAAVGRFDPRNVVLAAVSPGAEGPSARVAPDFGNRALFDHDYDHLPAMVLVEAARQLTHVATVRDGSAPAVSGLHAEFGRHAELDQPLTAHARIADDGGQVAVTFHHDGPDPVATVTIDLDRRTP